MTLQLMVEEKIGRDMRLAAERARAEEDAAFAAAMGAMRSAR